MRQQCQIQLFGGLQVSLGDQAITHFSTRQCASLLAYLAFHLHGRQHPREVLATLCWPDVTPKSGRTSLNNALASLRRQLEPPGIARGSIILCDRQTVRLNPDTMTTDVLDFEKLLKTAPRAASPGERAECLSDAINLYRGELLPGFYEDWVITEQRRLAGVYFQAVDNLIAQLVQTREYQAALEYARRAVSLDPLREETHLQLMRLHVALKQPASAMQQYRALESLLREQLGTAPSAAIRQVAREIERRSTSGISPITISGQTTATAPIPPQTASDAMRRNEPKSSTITFLATDMEGSAELPHRCSAILHSGIEEHGGELVREAAGSFLVAFTASGRALICAMECQKALAALPKEEGQIVAIRMALHTGDVNLAEGSYDGHAVDASRRMASAAHGGQILCSQTTAEILRRDPLPESILVDLGLYRMRGSTGPERIFQIAHPDLVRDFLPLRLEAGYQSRLPVPLTRFFGREAEIAQLQEMLLAEDIRLVTLTGPGGAGKTRLSLEVAHRLLEAFAGAVWFVPLADLSNARLIAGTVADAIGLQRSPQLDPQQQVIEALGRQPSLLVLDNLEQMVDEGGDIIRTLLHRVPTLTCFVTSRQALLLTGEREVPLAPLRIPKGVSTPEALTLYESVRLFVDRAQAARPDFQVTNHNAAAVAELCSRLEGIPLAIELAAARAQTLTPAQMLGQMEHRFDLLVTRKRDVEDRHRTLRAAIEWSYRLLPPEVQDFFACLSVFRGGWTADAAASVFGAEAPEGVGLDNVQASDYLFSLRECSLILTSDTGTIDNAPVRFRMLETLREFGAEKMTPDEQSAVRQRHAACFLQVVEQAAAGMRGQEQVHWLDRLEAEHDNLRAALLWATDYDPGAGLLLAASLPLFWDIRGHWREGYVWLTDLLERNQDGDTALRAKALLAAGNLAKVQGNYPAARDALQASYKLLVAGGSERDLAFVLNGLGILAQDQGDNAEAERHLKASLTIKLKLGDRLGEATTRMNLGYLGYLQDECVAARGEFEAAVAILTDSGHTHLLANALNNLGGVTRLQGDYGAARVLLQQSLDMRLEIGDEKNLAYSFDEFAHLAAAQGNLSEATVLLSAAEALRVSKSITLSPPEQERRAGLVEHLRRDLGADEFQTEQQRGLLLTVGEAVALARKERES